MRNYDIISVGKRKEHKMEKYEIISEGTSWGIFDTEEQAYNYAVNHIHRLKLICGDIYIPYEIKKIK